MGRIIFDVGHPAQVHNFKHTYWELKKKGWVGLFTAKDKEVTVALLESYNLPYVIIGKSGKNLLSKVFGLAENCIRFFSALRKFKPDIVICRFSPHASWCTKLLGIPTIGLADTEHTVFLDSLTVPLIDVKLTANSYKRDLGKNHFRFDGNIELFYLHPNRYTLPDKVDNLLNINPGEEYVIIRFVSWAAHHDVGEKGFALNDKLELIHLLEDKFKIFISSEGVLPPELLKYKVNIAPDKLHDALSHASLYIGEGASIASEAACLGIPSFYINSLTAGSIEEEIKYGLLYYFKSPKDFFQSFTKILSNKNLKRETQIKQKIFLNDNIDVTALLVWFIENYPKSKLIMQENPGYQLIFK